MKTPFEILNIPERCSDEEAKTAYLQLIRQFPPERFPEKFKEIQAAFEKVKTERERIATRLFRLDPFASSDLWNAIKSEEQRIQVEQLVRIISEISDNHLKQWILEKVTESTY